MKRTIIPAETPGTFRPEWGQFPEQDAKIIAWFVDGHSQNLVALPAHILPHVIYAWQYAPVAPPVEGLEAFKAGWSNGPEIYSGHGYRYHAANGLLVDGYNIVPKLRQIENFPTLAAAQEAAYKHFLSTLND